MVTCNRRRNFATPPELRSSRNLNTRAVRSPALTVASARRLSLVRGLFRGTWRTRIFTYRSRSPAINAVEATSRGTVWSVTRASTTREKSERNTRNNARSRIDRHPWFSDRICVEIPSCPERSTHEETRNQEKRIRQNRTTFWNAINRRSSLHEKAKRRSTIV